MAVVAFPFSTCFTSEDIEDVNSLQPYTVHDRANKGQEPQSRLDDVVSSALEPIIAGEVASSDPSGETRPRTDAEQIYDDFGAALDDDHDDDDDGNNGTDNHLKDVDVDQEMEIEEAPVNIDRDTEQTITTAQAETTSTITEETETKSVDVYGGLSNLGNTCFMNSALQMVASLDNFTKQLEYAQLPNASDNQEGTDSESSGPNVNLRRAFLDVMASLEKGETVSPTEFKHALDERTPLFLGYHQEDSHEFLTTLFDLLDADYKHKATDETTKEDETKTTSNIEEGKDNESEAPAGTDVETDLQQEHTASDYPDSQVDMLGEETHMTTKEEHKVSVERQRPESYESATKRPRNLETGEDSQELQPMGGNSLSRVCQSFSDLQPDGIEELLNARLSGSMGLDEAVTTPSPPRCKLAGGRMPASEANGTVLFGDSDTSMASPSIELPRQEQDGSASRAMSPVESYLQTEVRVRLTCESCKYTRSHQENFLHLSLEIDTDEEAMSGNVADGLRKFFAPEKREIKCEKCFYESAQQTMEITRLPRALLLHFKRFIVDYSDDWSSITYRKNQSDVLFDEALEFDGVLSEFVADADVCFPQIPEEDCEDDEAARTYNIRSIVNHIGASAACGHYTGDAHRKRPDGERRWNRFNDSYVSDISSDEAIRDSTKTAYMVMYELSRE